MYLIGRGIGREGTDNLVLFGPLYETKLTAVTTFVISRVSGALVIPICALSRIEPDRAPLVCRGVLGGTQTLNNGPRSVLGVGIVKALFASVTCFYELPLLGDTGIERERIAEK